MTTDIQSKVQELESRQDFYLLVNGDLVNVNLAGYDGVAIFEKIDNKLIPGLDLLVLEVPKEFSSPFKYLIRDTDLLDVQKNKIVGRNLW